MGLFMNRKKKLKEKELRYSYDNIKDKLDFRFKTLKKLIGDKKIILGVDTNLMDRKKDVINLTKDLCDLLDEANIHYRKIPILNKNRSSIFGIELDQKGKSRSAYAVIMELNKGQFSEELFYEFLSYSDLIIGAEPKRDFHPIVEDLEMDYDIMFAQRSYFNDYIYDSMNFSIIRSGSNRTP